MRFIASIRIRRMVANILAGAGFFERSNKANRLWRKKGDDDGVCKSVTSAGGSDEPAGAKENVGGQKF